MRVYILIRLFVCVFHALVGHSFHRCVFHCYYSLVEVTPAVWLWIFGVYTLILSGACFHSPFFALLYFPLLLFCLTFLFLLSISSSFLYCLSCIGVVARVGAVCAYVCARACMRAYVVCFAYVRVCVCVCPCVLT